MKTAFADTFYWVALTSPKDQWHRKAQTICADLKITHLVTTDEVLVEFLTQLATFGPRLRLKAVTLVKAIMSDPNIRVIRQSRDSFDAGLAFYESRPDKGYSMTDCISMNTMRSEALSDALNFDEHFIQEGLRLYFAFE